ncbi:MAG: beta/alpha barrel domain-containing protein [Candidatus Humimicrobiaceae bacterium]
MEIFKAKNGILIELNSDSEKIINNIISSTKDLPFIIGYKLNAESIILNGLKSTVKLIKKQTNLPLIYDHKKLGSDSPDISGGNIIEKIKKAGVDAVVILPYAGKEILEKIIESCNEVGLLTVVCGDLPYKGYFNDEDGYIDTESQQKIYLDAARLGVSHFLMSCNRIERIKIYCHQLDSIVVKLKIFLTAIDSKDCTNLPESCSQLKQNDVYAVFDNKFVDSAEYINLLKVFWESFQNKLS